MKHWKRFFLKYFDWNDDGVTNWWEYFIPIVIILIIEIIAELVANWIV
jgi:hypothetical protein